MKRVLVGIFVVSSIVSFGFSIHAQVAYGGINPFGGRTEYSYYCDCTPGCWWLTIGSPRGGEFMYCPYSTTLYEYYNIWEPAWQLGLAPGYMACMEIHGEECDPVGYGYLMQIDGTSSY